MGVCDSMCDAVELIEEWERGKERVNAVVGVPSDFTGYPWDDLRKI